MRRASRTFALQLRRALDEAEILAAARAVVQSFTREARRVPDAYEWWRALADTAPVYPAAAEFAARADALADAIPPEQRGTDLHPEADPEFEQLSAEKLVAQIARGEYRYTYGDELIEGGAEPDLGKMRRPHPLYWPIGYRCARGHPLFDIHERPPNSDIYHGSCDECPERRVWAYAEWDEPVPEHLPRSRLHALSAPPS